MEFSRLEQFQAVLVGMVVADAVVQGKIAALALKMPPAPPLPHSWRQSLIHGARQLSQHSPEQSRVDAAIEGGSEIAQVMIQIPMLLRYVDDSVEPWLEISKHLTSPNRVLTAQLCQLLQTLLRLPQDQPLSTRLSALKAWADDHRSQEEASTVMVTQALTSVVQAAGDFRLAIASLSIEAEPLLPVWVGVMCTALRGLSTIPVAWRQALVPTQASSWYADCWGLTDERELRDIATDLWRAWAGLHPLGS